MSQRRCSADCHPDRPNRARGLCASCHAKANREGTIEQHPRRRGRFPALAEDALWVLECGCRCHVIGGQSTHGVGRGCPCGGIRALADRLGVPRDTLAKALLRARARQVAA